ncbi:MAG: nucleotidyltransferase family protein, partial [Clostridia bacterium]|nr:nucleotidyltransferase family protein [Clostridia bacterium]
MKDPDISAAPDDGRKALLGLLSSSLFGAQAPDLSGCFARTALEAQSQGVFLTAMQNADASAEPPEARAELHAHVRGLLEKNIALGAAHVGLSSLLENAGIRFVMIKGFASAAYYPAPELRQCGDVDFCVEPSDVGKTEALLRNEGFVPEKLSHGVHHVFSKDGARYELHFGIPGMPSGEAGERCSVYFS